MRLALVDGQLAEASKGDRGICRVCKAVVVGRQGEVRINHWAHKAKTDCPAALKEETLWHRHWKDHYPLECQEWHSTNEQTGEHHFADVRTQTGLVLEFQNSPIDGPERRSREGHYKNMLWVVNGTRKKRTFKNFLEHLLREHPVEGGRWHYIPHPDQAFPVEWQNSSVPVLFDFLGDSPDEIPLSERNPLWCLLPGKVKRHGLVLKVLRKEFLERTRKTNGLFRAPLDVVMAEREMAFPKVEDDWFNYLAAKSAQKKGRR